MKARVLLFDQLGNDDLASWYRLRAENPAWAGPFFSPRFSAAVHAARQDVRVAIIEDAGQVVGILPFHQIRRSAKPVGRFYNDAHNLIQSTAGTVDWDWLLSQMGLRAYDFHAMVGQTADSMAPHDFGTVRAFAADLESDSEGFLARLERTHRTIAKQAQKTRKLAREIGPVRLQIECPDKRLLDQTIQWKRLHYQRTNILDLFTPPWTRTLMHRLHHPDQLTKHGACQTRPMQGLLSVLWAGDQPIASHYGMLEDDRLHYWIPTYDTRYAKYSPGTALFTEMVRHAGGHGIRLIDMGYGEQPYKEKQTDVVTEVAYGSITRSVWHRTIRKAEVRTALAIKRLPMKEHLKRVWRKLQPQAGISKLR